MNCSAKWPVVCWLFSLFILLITGACNPQICPSQECNEQGIVRWDDGICSCECLSGFGGELCDSSLYNTLAAVYTLNDSCGLRDTLKWTQDDSDSSLFYLEAWQDFGCVSAGKLIEMRISFDTLQIDTQLICGDSLLFDHTIYGSGSVNFDGTASLAYTVWYAQGDSLVSLECSAEFGL